MRPLLCSTSPNKVCVLIALCIALTFGSSLSFSQQQRIISYQGVINDANQNGLTGTHAMTFRIYPSDTSTTPLYQETQKIVFHQGGEFDALIGQSNALTPLTFSNPATDRYYLGVEVDNSGELTPRSPFSDVTRAFFADTAGVARTTLFADTALFARNVDPTLIKTTTVNGITPTVSIVGTGGTTVTTNGNTITINSTSSGSSAGVQTIAPLDGTISIFAPSGPTALLGLVDSSIATRKLAGSAVTNSKIASGAVTMDKVASGAATPGLVLTADGAGGTLWQSPTAQAITLPYSGTASLPQSLFSLTNTGSGTALTTIASGTAISSSVTGASGIAVQGTTSDGGAGTVPNTGVLGTSAGGHGVAGLTNAGDAVYASAATTGNAIHGVVLAGATTARAGYFENLGSSNSGNVLESHSIGTGDAGYFQISNASNAAPGALVATTNGIGSAGNFSITNSSDAAAALVAATNGTSQAGNFSVTNTASTTSALQASTSSTAAGAMGMFGWASNTSGTGTGILGQAEGQGATGVQGIANNVAGNGTGLYGQTKGSGGNGYGVYGWASNTTGSSFGIWGQAEGANADAIVGLANNSSGSGVGVYGWSKGSSGIGMYGESDGTLSGSIGIRGVMNSATTSGTFAAVRGDCYTPSANGFGVEGQVMSAGPGVGVYGVTAGSGYAVEGQNSNTAGIGILGLVSSTNYAIWGQNQGTGIGVYGQSTTSSVITSYGLYGTTSNSNTAGIGVYGQGAYGVRGVTLFNGGWGVYGTNSGGTGYGVYGTGAGGSGYAIYGTTAGGSGYGVFGTNASNGTGTGVYAEAGGTGNCLIANYTGSTASSTTSNNLAIFRKGGVNYARIDNTGVGYFDGGTQNSGADVAEALVPTGIRSEYE
ncbi:MAG TPA: hypothetical protein VGM92_07975, partial [Candidatus Kapabacteria bacterium]